MPSIFPSTMGVKDHRHPNGAAMPPWKWFSTMPAWNPDPRLEFKAPIGKGGA